MIQCQLEKIELHRGHGFCFGVEDLTISSEQARRIPIIGHTGAGKSTLLNILAGMEWPHRGTVRWSFPKNGDMYWGPSGEHLTEAQVRQLRQHYFGYAFQSSTLISHLTVGDNLCYPLIFQGYSAEKAKETARQALLDVLLDNEHDDGIFQRFPNTLSGGQLQRVALAQSIVHDPYVLFADEPTGSLDYDTRKKVMGLLDRWLRKSEEDGKERMLFWVTHHQNDPGDHGDGWLLKVRQHSNSQGTCLFERFTEAEA